MPIFQLDDRILFPHPSLANSDGIIAIGGDLKPERLLNAYSNGIFPWFNHNEPPIWWSPDPRFVLFPDKVKFSKSMRKIFKKGIFDIKFDTDFKSVIKNCSEIKRNHEAGTWITDNMIDAYIKLHDLGFAHSIETYHQGKLVGGLYGISLGGVFMGESMFAYISNASKAAFLTLVTFLKKKNFDLIDSQVHTKHLESLGGEHISRDKYLNILYESIEKNTLRGKWVNNSL